MSRQAQWSVHFRRVGTEHMDAVLVDAGDAEEAMRAGQQLANALWGTEPTPPMYCSLARLPDGPIDAAPEHSVIDRAAAVSASVCDRIAVAVRGAFFSTSSKPVVYRRK